MKKFIKLFSSVALLLMFCLALSSFGSVQPVDDPGNGTEVYMFKNVGWVLDVGPCGQFYEQSSSTQLKDGELHLMHVIWDVSESPCFVDRATKVTIGTPWGPATANLTPSGKLILKLVVN